MAVAFRSIAAVEPVDQASVTFSAPAGRADGDVLIALMYIESGQTMTGPAGFTDLGVVCHNEVAYEYDLHAWWHRISSVGSEPTYRWDTTPSTYFGGFLLCLSDPISTGSPIAATPLVQSNGSASTSLVLPSYTPGQTNTLLIGSVFGSANGAWTWPGGTTKQGDVGGISCATEFLSAATATGTRTPTTSSGANAGFVLSVLGTDSSGGGGAPTIVTETLPNGTDDVAYSQTVVATGGTEPYDWSVSAGALPDGLSLNSSTGEISGTPTVVDTFNFTITVTDDALETDDQALSITIDAVAVLTITTNSLPGGTEGVVYSQTVQAVNGATPYAWDISAGALPDGLSINASTGAITGTPTVPNTFNFTVRVTDDNTDTDTQALTIIVSPAAAGTTEAFAAWNFVPFQDVTGTFPIGVLACEPGVGINRVEIVVNGGAAVSVTQRSWMEWDGYRDFCYVRSIDCSTFANGALTLTATVFPTSGDSVVLPEITVYNVGGTGDALEDITVYVSGTGNDSSGTGLEGAPFQSVHRAAVAIAAAASTATYGGRILHLGGDVLWGQYQFSGEDTEGQLRWLRIEPDDGVTRAQARIIDGNGNYPRIGRMEFSGVTIDATLITDSQAATNYVWGRGCSMQGTVRGGHESWPTPIPWAWQFGPLGYDQGFVTSHATYGRGEVTDVVTAHDGADFVAGVDVHHISGVAFQSSPIVRDWGAWDIIHLDIPDEPHPDIFWMTSLEGSAAPKFIGAGRAPYDWDCQGLFAGAGTEPILNMLVEGGAFRFNDAIFVSQFNTGLQNVLFLNCTIFDQQMIHHEVGSSADVFYVNCYFGSIFLDGTAGEIAAAVTGRSNHFETPGDSFGTGASTGDGGFIDPDHATLADLRPDVGSDLLASGATVAGFNLPEGVNGVGNPAAPNKGAWGYVASPDGWVAEDAPTIVTTSLPSGVTSTPYSQTVTATGGTTPYTWTVSAGALPNGLTLNASTGEISGTPTAANTYNFTIQVEDDEAEVDTQALSIVISLHPTITTTTLPAGEENTAYSQQLSATGGVLPLVWDVSAGALPDGLTMSAGGLISGTPTVPDTFNFTARVTDDDSNVDTQALEIVITAEPSDPPPVITTPGDLPNAVDGAAYSVFIEVDDGTLPLTWNVQVGMLPTGLSLNTATGEISGTPATGTTIIEEFGIRVTDDDGRQDNRVFTLVVSGSSGTRLMTMLGVG